MKSSTLPILVMLLLLAGCATYTDLPPGTIQQVSGSPIIEQQSVSVPAVALDKAPPAPEYRIGPGDVLLINVNGKPELSSPGLTATGRVAGSRVDGKGILRLPMIGRIAVGGMSLDQVEKAIGSSFSRYLSDPWVVVEIAEYRSHPLYLLGQFKNSGTFYMDRPLTLLNGLALGGGMLDTANLRSARLVRDGRILPVDIYQLLREGALEQNIWLKAGDTIYVPDDKNQNVYLFGAVANPGPVPMPNGRLTLSQALASAGVEETGANSAYIRIIRSVSATRGELLVVDQSRVLQGLALPLTLNEGDIVYVPRSGIGSWNQALKEILPSLQTISAVLQPFVSIKYLDQ